MLNRLAGRPKSHVRVISGNRLGAECYQLTLRAPGERGTGVASDRQSAMTMADTDLPAAMARVAEVVEAALEALLPEPEGAEARLADAMRYATLGGGKRLRAFLVMQSAALFAVSETCAARVAASIEMLHAYSLVHDDLPAMDDDDLRRGKPSTHKAFDEATAILAGDALQARAFEVLAEPDTHSDPQARCELVAALGAAAGARGMAGGQMIDMLAEGQEAGWAGGDPTAGSEDRAADPVQRRGGGHPRPGAPCAAASSGGLWPRPRGSLPDRG